MIIATLKSDIAISLGEFLDDYDIDGIAGEIEERYPDAQKIDDVPSGDYWDIVAGHDITEG